MLKESVIRSSIQDLGHSRWRIFLLIKVFTVKYLFLFSESLTAPPPPPLSFPSHGHPQVFGPIRANFVFAKTGDSTNKFDKSEIIQSSPGEFFFLGVGGKGDVRGARYGIGKEKETETGENEWGNNAEIRLWD